ncbi:MAG: M50 family metallopeptidase [Clostridia bacterium]|nr:M50 family metallopeptidase [Clostridia bacterium]
MKYPMCSNWLQFENNTEDTCTVTNHAYQTSCTLDLAKADFLCALDGKRDPYSIDPARSMQEVTELLTELDELDLLRWRRLILFSRTACFALWFPKKSKLLTKWAQVCTRLLRLLWLPLLVIGIALFCLRFSMESYSHMLIGAVMGIVLGAVGHELSHALCGIDRGAYVMEAGIMVRDFLPGGYVFCEDRHLKKWDRIAITAAGVQFNFLFAGFCLILAGLFSVLADVLRGAAVANCVMPMLNLLPVSGLDGMSMLSDLLEVEDFSRIARQALFHRSTRRKLKAMGAPGRLLLVLCAVVQFVQIFFVVLIAANVYFLIRGIFKR